ncbi:MAG: MFS transporter [Bacteroidaceae bacterium]|nr:MFS transporter [Bacteroidaceae bacterium]MBQ3957537.1 MFS transporter [Bacteroidaceae bacterium]MBQ4002749.1 MFS transporter [Bacteroidaceae bacterium]
MNLKFRLTLLNFLEFAVWGAYLTSMGTYLAGVGLGSHIGWFYSVQGIVSIFMPALMGILADRWMEGQRVLSLCHALAGLFMIAASCYGYQAGAEPQFGMLFMLYTLSVAFFMPTIALSYSVAYSALEKAGLDTVKAFPPIRVWGTVGFIVTMWIVDLCGLQKTPGQWMVSGCLSLVLAAYALTMPRMEIKKDGGQQKSLAEALGLNAFKLFLNPRMALFMCFAMLLGFCLQISNGYANPFITSFGSIEAYQATFGVQHANILISLSQMSETLCILLIPFFLSRFGIKKVVLIALLGWVLRFGFFAVGNPGNGVWLFLLSMIVYGVAFDFFNISGSLFINQETDDSIRSSAQGLFMMMTNGLGAFVGTLVAQAVINHYVFTPQSAGAEGTEVIAGWQTCWYIFAAYALVVAVLFAIFFRYKHNPATK